MPPSTGTGTGVVIPSSCTSDQLFQDANEVVSLSTDLATLEDQFDRHFLHYYEQSPSGYGEDARKNWALNQIKDKHQQLWTEIDTKRARMRGLQMKSNIVRSAISVAKVEAGHFD